MQLDNAKRDFLIDSEEETTRMTISKDVESHIVKILTESYSDPLGSAIREAVSNAVDSVTEAGNSEPVLVSIKRNIAGQNELTIEDKGLGLDDASFKKYIMGLGESTKRDNPNLLGGYGAGAKAWLSYTDSFNYVCRKDGIERKYMIFKGEEYPESTLIYEKPTEEVNGVIISVLLRGGWYEMDNCKTKIKQQLCYLDNVYYDIEGFDNKYTVYRGDDFQFSNLGQFRQMHISLKDIYYPIDWNKLKIAAIDTPIALRFTDYDDIKPIFNRESIQYTAATIKAIEQKIIKVADWFAEKWNNEVAEFNTLREARHAIEINDRYVNMFDNTLDIKQLLTYSSIPIKEPTVKDIEFRKPTFYIKLGNRILEKWSANAIDEGDIWKKANIRHFFESEILRRGDNIVVLADYEVSGNIKQYLREKYEAGLKRVFYVKETNKESNRARLSRKEGESNYIDYNSYESMLQLTNIPQEDWDFYINEYLTVQKQYENTFVDERGLPEKQEYIDWLEAKKAARKAGLVPSTGNYVALNKEKGQITIYKARNAARGDGITYDKKTIDITSLSKLNHLVIYFPAMATNLWTGPSRIQLFMKHHQVWKLNPSEIKHVTNLKQFLSIEQFMASKAFARMATKLLINELLDSEPDKIDNITDAFKDVAVLRGVLEKYITRDDVKLFSLAHGNVREAILEQARESNNWDMEVYPTVLAYEKKIKQLGFVGVLKDLNSYRTSETEKSIIKNVMYIMLKHQKITGKMIEDFELVPKPQPLPEETEQGEALILGELSYEDYAEVVNEAYEPQDNA